MISQSITSKGFRVLLAAAALTAGIAATARAADDCGPRCTVNPDPINLCRQRAAEVEPSLQAPAAIPTNPAAAAAATECATSRGIPIARNFKQTRIQRIRVAEIGMKKLGRLLATARASCADPLPIAPRRWLDWQATVAVN